MKLLLILGICLSTICVSIITIIVQQRSLPKTDLSPPPATSCANPGPILQHTRLFPEHAGEISITSGDINLYSTGVLSLQGCRSGLLTFTASGQEVKGWGSQLTIYQNGILVKIQEIEAEKTLSLKTKAGDNFMFALTNDAVAFNKRYLTVNRQKGPWCSTDPSQAEAGAWLRPSGDYGDITSGGKLHFRTCQNGKAQFRLEGVSEDGEAPIIQILINGKVFQSRKVEGRELISINITVPSEITFTVLNPSKSSFPDRKLYLKGMTIR